MPNKFLSDLFEAASNGGIVQFSVDGLKVEFLKEQIEAVPAMLHRGGKWLAFTRSLEYYGFEKLAEAPQHLVYENAFFRHGHPELLDDVQTLFHTGKRRELRTNRTTKGKVEAPKRVRFENVELPEGFKMGKLGGDDPEWLQVQF